MTAQTPKAGPPPDEGVFSLEDLDKIIATEDPNFHKEMQDITSVSTEGVADIQSLDPDDIVEIPHAEEKDKDWRDKVINFVTLYKTKIKLWYRTRILNFRSWIKGFIADTKQYARHELPERIKYYRVKAAGGIKNLSSWFRTEIDKFKALTRAQKAGFLFMCLAGLASLLLLSKTWTGAWLPTFSTPLIKSLAQGGGRIKSYKDKSDLQDLFHAFPEVEFHVLLKKVIVNLKPDANSTSNPMGLYEVYLGLDSQDTAIEVKDREREVLDVIQRALEGFTYTDVNSQVGKIRMKSAIKDELNLILNQGQVFHVYFNNFVTKQ